MKVRSARFVRSVATAKDVTVYAPQIAVAGRSNCGKSSLLNMLMGAKLCKTSATPGRTRLINVFEVAAEPDFFFIDLPGYGYGSASRAERDSWNIRTESYFTDNDCIAQVLCLMDIRREPSDLDKVLIDFLRNIGLPFTVILTKADKLSRAQTATARINIAAALGLARDNLIVTSAAKNVGREQTLDRLGEILSNL